MTSSDTTASSGASFCGTEHREPEVDPGIGSRKCAPKHDSPFAPAGRKVRSEGGAEAVKTRETNADYLRRLRREAVAAGLCAECRCRRPEPGKRTCEVCLERSRERRAAYVGVGLCVCGRKIRTVHARCAKCRAMHARSNKRVRRRKIDAGLCAWHTTNCSVPPMPGKTMCGMHLAIAAGQVSENAYLRLARGECTTCGKANPTSAWRCQECRDRVNERRRQEPQP